MVENFGFLSFNYVCNSSGEFIKHLNLGSPKKGQDTQIIYHTSHFLHVDYLFDHMFVILGSIYRNGILMCCSLPLSVWLMSSIIRLLLVQLLLWRLYIKWRYCVRRTYMMVVCWLLRLYSHEFWHSPAWCGKPGQYIYVCNEKIWGDGISLHLPWLALI